MICARDSKLVDFAESIVHFTLCSSQLMLGWILHGNVHMFNVHKNVCRKLLMMMLVWSSSPGHYGNHAGEICAFAHASREILKKRFFCCCFEYHLMDSFANVIIWADGKMYVHSFIRLVLGWKSAWKSTEYLKIRDPINIVFFSDSKSSNLLKVCNKPLQSHPVWRLFRVTKTSHWSS